MLLAVSVGVWAFILVSCFMRGWLLFTISLLFAVLFYWWRFQLLFEREHDPNYDCTLVLYCFQVS
jgi:hypothetical protein